MFFCDTFFDPGVEAKKGTLRLYLTAALVEQDLENAYRIVAPPPNRNPEGSPLDMLQDGEARASLPSGCHILLIPLIAVGGRRLDRFDGFRVRFPGCLRGGFPGRTSRGSGRLTSGGSRRLVDDVNVWIPGFAACAKSNHHGCGSCYQSKLGFLIHLVNGRTEGRCLFADGRWWNCQKAGFGVAPSAGAGLPLGS